MRCDCCDKELNEFECTRKSAISGEYLNTCNKCLKGLGIQTIDRTDLNPYAPTGELDEDFIDDLLDEEGEEE